VNRPPDLALFDAFHKSNPRKVTTPADMPEHDAPTTPQPPLSPPIATISDSKRTSVKAESSFDSITILSPQPYSSIHPGNTSPDVFSASSSRKRSIIDENFAGPSGSGKRLKMEAGMRATTPPIIDISSSQPVSPVSSDSSSGLEEMTNSPTKLRITSPAARALAKRGLRSYF
jgi:hypothetical protein